MKLVNIKNITLIEAMEIYNKMGISFIIKDGKLKGFTR